MVDVDHVGFMISKFYFHILIVIVDCCKIGHKCLYHAVSVLLILSFSHSTLISVPLHLVPLHSISVPFHPVPHHAISVPYHTVPVLFHSISSHTMFHSILSCSISYREVFHFSVLSTLSLSPPTIKKLFRCCHW